MQKAEGRQAMQGNAITHITTHFSQQYCSHPLSPASGSPTYHPQKIKVSPLHKFLHQSRQFSTFQAYALCIIKSAALPPFWSRWQLNSDQTSTSGKSLSDDTSLAHMNKSLLLSKILQL